MIRKWSSLIFIDTVRRVWAGSTFYCDSTFVCLQPDISIVCRGLEVMGEKRQKGEEGEGEGIRKTYTGWLFPAFSNEWSWTQSSTSNRPDESTLTFLIVSRAWSSAPFLDILFVLDHPSCSSYSFLFRSRVLFPLRIIESEVKSTYRVVIGITWLT